MNERIARLRNESFETYPSISIERARLTTDFYRANEGKYPVPVMRALNFKNLCEQKTLYIGKDELIVGERGPAPKAVSTFPELSLNKWGYIVADEKTGATSVPGVYAGGDIVTGAATVILAMGAGKDAAVAMDEFITKKRASA